MRRRFMSNVNSFDIDNYLTFKAGINPTPLAITFSGGDIEYCIDGSGEWITLPNGSQTAFVNSGHTISFRANLTPVQNNGIGSFNTVYLVEFSLLGNCMSLLYGDNAASYDTVPDYAFRSLFSRLRVTHVSKNFLPATILGCKCYYNMFRFCGDLTMAPELPATTLTPYCYYDMFNSCSKLKYIKMLATDISAFQCLHNWVENVASTGSFVKNPAMTSLPTATSDNSYVGIPSGWTVVNDGEKIENKLSYSISTSNDIIFTFQYPVESDVAIYFVKNAVGSATYNPATITKGNNTVTIATSDYNRITITRIVPNEDSAYIYTW